MSNIIDSIRLSGTTYQIQGDITVDTALDSGSTNPVENKAIYNKFDEVEEVTAAGLNALNDKITPTVELTQAQYDALTTKDPNTYYIITDAQAGDLTNYYTKTETNTLLGGKQATLVSGTNIKTINNESILGSGNIDIQGGSTYTAGRGISIANDAISVSLPISAGTGSNSIAEGDGTTASGIYGSHAEGYHTRATGWGAHAEGNSTQASGNYSHAEGDQTEASGNYSHTEGFGTIANNLVEHASGQYNVSSKANNTFGNSGNTLFSVGNGTSAYARHNVFEIRQNGDIYLSLNGQDIKLQDQLGGSSITVDTALDSGSTNPVENRVIYNKIDEVEQVTAAALNELNEAVSGKQETLVSSQNIKTINNESILGSGNIVIGGGGSSYTAGDGIDITNDVISVTGKVDTTTYNAYTAATDTALASKADTSAVTAIQDSLSGYVTTDTEQTISGKKVFTYSSNSAKAIEFKQTIDTAKVGFSIKNSASTNNELASFEFRPNTFTIDGVQHPLLYFGHYRNRNTANAGVPQTYIGFRQYDQSNAAAYHYLLPLPEKAKTPFNLTTSFKDYYAPMGFKNGSTMITADDTGVVDLSSELGGLKLKKLTQAEYNALATKDSSTLYIIVN